MKNFTIPVVAFAVITFIFTSCKHDAKEQLAGTWKMTDMKIGYYDRQRETNKKQMQTFQDSIALNTDTAKLSMFKRRLAFTEKGSNEFESRLDSSFKNSRVEFKSNGDYTDNQLGTEQTGIWSLDEDKMILFTIIDNNTNSVHVRLDRDTFVMQFDSLNYMKFVKVK